MSHARNVIIAALVGLVLIELADTKKPAESAPPVPAGAPVVGAAEATPEWMNCVYRVRQKTGTGAYGGTAISLGEGLLVTAAHVLGTNTTPEVNVNGKWVPAGFQRVQGQDVAYLTIRDTSLPGVPVRQPVRGERVRTYGMTTRLPWPGQITGDVSKEGMWKVQLLTDLEGTESGDSGGGVFGEDGSLLLIHALRGAENNTWGTPLNPPVPYARATVATEAPNPSSAPASPPKTVLTCPGGVCPAPSYQVQPARPRLRIFRR